eukprot:142711_1
MSTLLIFIAIFCIDSFVGENIICPAYPPTTYLHPSVFTNVLNEIDEYIQTNIIKENNITGFITSIIYDQQLLFSKGYGLKNYMNQSSPPPTGDDLVMIASNTKLFTTLLAYYLRDNYNLSFNDPITKYLPEFSIQSIYDSNKPLTLRELLSHTAGLQDEIPMPNGDNSNESSILSELSTRYLIYAPYSQYKYSNLGFSLLGRSIEKLFCAGCYEEYTKKLILNGLNFSEYSGFNYSQNIIDNHCAYGWYIDDNGNKKQGPIESFGWPNPSGAMLASTNDMAKLMMFMLRNNITTDQHPYQILDGTTVTEILKPKLLLNDGMEAIGTPFEMHYHQFQTLHGYNGGSSMSGVWYKGKQGEVLGYRSSLMMIPEYKLGVFTVALEDPEYISEGSVWSNNILDIMLPIVDNLLYEKYVDNIQYFIPKNYKLLIGKYVCGGNDMVNIELMTDRNGKQYLLYDGGGSGKHNFLLFKDGIMNVFRLGNDVEITDETCFWGEVPQTNELVYFNFANGSNNHAVSLLRSENECVYQNN